MNLIINSTRLLVGYDVWNGVLTVSRCFVAKITQDDVNAYREIHGYAPYWWVGKEFWVVGNDYQLPVVDFRTPEKQAMAVYKDTWNDYTCFDIVGSRANALALMNDGVVCI